MSESTLNQPGTDSFTALPQHHQRREGGRAQERHCFVCAVAYVLLPLFHPLTVLLRQIMSLFRILGA